jgi:acetylxylan esterase
MRPPTLFTALLPLLSTTAAQTPGILTPIRSFNSRPNTTSRATLHVYLPHAALRSPPTLLTAVHHCAGSGTGFFGSTPYRALAEKFGFVVLFPGSPHSGGCWDVSSPASLRYGGGGDSGAIADMMAWAMKEWGVARERSFVVGVSSGAMMTVSFQPSPPLHGGSRTKDEAEMGVGYRKENCA